MIIFWYLFKLALIYFPIHLWGEYRDDARFIDMINKQPPSQVVYWIPAADKNEPQIVVKVTYPAHIKNGSQYLVTYEIENYPHKEKLLFDLHLKSDNKSFSSPVVFNSMSPSKLTGTLLVKSNSTTTVLEFQPEVIYQGEKFEYTKIHQIQVHTLEDVLAINARKWKRLVYFVVALVLWFLFLIWI